MRNKVLFSLAAFGLALGILAAWYFHFRQPPQPPAFAPPTNPFERAIYANGIIESAQDSGSNIDLYPEVSGPIVKILVAEGESVRAGEPLLLIDSTVQQAVAEQQRAAADAAHALLEQLRRQPRPETLEVARAQVEAAAASVRQASDSFDKQHRAYEIEPKSVSREALDTAENAVRVARANLQVATRQFELTRAGAWSYDIRNQEKLAESLDKQAVAANALLQKFALRAPSDGVVLALEAALGSYASPQGTYDTYTQGAVPLIVMSRPQRYLAVRVYVDEILVQRLPAGGAMDARMQIRGTDLKLALEFVRIQPYATPKIELSDARQERVDLRVVPVLFRFAKPAKINLYPGQLVDVYIREK